MRTQQKRNLSEILPPELWQEILIRLPVRSLLTLKCVSKSFISLIENPSFPTLHFNHFNNNLPAPKGYELTISECPESDNIHNLTNFLIHRSIYDETDDDSLEVEVEFPPTCCVFGPEVVGYANGLVLINMIAKNHLIVANPSIRKSLIIPLASDCDWDDCFTALGFGYDPLSDDYKVVVIEVTQPSSLVEVYSVKNASWRSFDAGADSIVGSWHLTQNVNVNGAIHWMAGKFHEARIPDAGNCMTHIASFDLSTEVFSYTKLPDLVGVERIKFPLIFDGSFAVVTFSSTHVCLWVMRENGCWTKDFEAELLSEYFELVRFYDINNVIYLEKTHELVCGRDRGLFLYNTETKQIWNYKHDYSTGYVAPYVESLFWFPRE